MAWILSLFSLSVLVSQSGMDALSIVVTLSMLVLKWQWIQQKSSHRLFYTLGFDFVFIAWFVITASGYFVNNVDSNWLERLLEFKWILFFYILSSAFIYVNPSERIVKYACILVGICSAYAISVFIIGYDPIRGPDYPMSPMAGSVRTGGFYANAMVFAHVYGLVFSLLAGMFLVYWRWKEKGTWLLFIATLLTAIALLLSFTRGVWIAVTAALIVMSFVYGRRWGIAVIAFLMAVVFVLISAWPDLRERVHTAFTEGGDVERVYIWKSNWMMFKEHPLLGMGYGENARALPEYYKKLNAPEGLIVSHAHNQYLHYLAGTGAFGLSCYLIILFFFLRMNIRLWKTISMKNVFHKGLALGCLGAQVCLIFGGLTESNLEHSKMRYMISIIWALLVWLAYEHKILKSSFIS